MALHAGAGIEVGFAVVIFPDFVVGGLGGGPFEDDFLDDRAVFFGIDFVVAVFPTGIEPVGQDDEHVINHGQTSLRGDLCAVRGGITYAELGERARAQR